MDKVIGGMVPRPAREAVEILIDHLDLNAGDPRPGSVVEGYIREVVRITSRAVLGVDRPGWVTAGASEGNLLALYALREMGFRRVLLFDTAHYSVLKAARILGLEHKVLDTNGGRPSMSEVPAEVREGDIIVATVGTTQEGLVDPVGALASIAAEAGAAVHVDAAYAGYIARYLTVKAKFKLDPPIYTLVVDAHKLPEAPPPAGIILSCCGEVLDRMWFTAPYIPSGRQFGVLGTRPGGPIAAAAHILRNLDSQGFETIAEDLMERARRLVTSARDLGFEPAVEPEVPVVCLKHPNIEALMSRLENLGLQAYRCPRYGGVRAVFLYSTRVEEYLDAFERALG